MSETKKIESDHEELVREFEQEQERRKRKHKKSQSELQVIFNRVSVRPPPKPSE